MPLIVESYLRHEIILLLKDTKTLHHYLSRAIVCFKHLVLNKVIYHLL